MKKKDHSKYNISFFDIIKYIPIIFISNLAASYCAVGLTQLIFMPLVDKIPFVLLAIAVFVMYTLVCFGIPCAVIWFFFRSMARNHYMPSNDKWYWAKNCLVLVLPAEILRFVVCTITLGHINSTGYFAFLPSLLFENTYLLWTGRHELVRSAIQSNIADYFVFIICYLLYAVIHLLLVLVIYRRYWLVGKKDREDLIVHETTTKY